ITTSMVLIILVIFSKFEYLFYGKSGKMIILLKMQNIDGQIDLLGNKLHEFEMLFSNISVEAAEDNFVTVKVKAVTNKKISNARLLQELYKINGVNYIQISD
ncbi:MAG: hypothetical protein WBL93_04530, partial [Lutisporaceae bacterium]